MTWMRAWMSSKFCGIRPRTTELAALERMKKVPCNGENNVITFSQLFLIGSFSYFQVMRRIRVVSPVGRFAGSFRPRSFRPCFRGGSIRPY